MLSILRRQSVTLERELIEARQALEPLKRAVAEHEAVVAAKDERIKELENELRKRQPLDEVVLCRACGKAADAAEAADDAAASAGPWAGSSLGQVAPPPKAVPDALSIDTVCKSLDELKKRLRKTESKLTSAELEKSLAELQLLTQTSKLRRDLTRDLETTRTLAKAAAEKAAAELAAARAAERVAKDEAAAQQVLIAELRAGVKRRDEQVEFLMQVHDASQECEWVPVGEGWECPVCTLKNGPQRTSCEACGSPPSGEQWLSR